MTYILKSIVFLSIMYLPYMLLLRKESFFRFNRMMLLSIMLLSLVLPMCDFHFLSMADSPASGMLQLTLPEVVIGAPRHDAPTATQTDWITTLYIIGMSLTLIWKLAQVVMLRRQMNHGVLWKDRSDGVTILCHINDTAPYSWFNTIIISNDDYEKNSVEIIRHEMGHIRHRHSWDILLLNVIQTVQWLNPLAWIIGISLRDVHEYEADDAVLSSGVNALQYQTLLIRKAVGSSSYAFANSFNHSLLTKRITMMLRKKSNPWMRTKALYIIPVAVVALSAFATPKLIKKVDKIATAPIATTSVDKINEITPKQEISSKKITVMTENTDTAKIVEDNDEQVLTRPEKMPEYPGGMNALMVYLSKSLKYPVIAQKNNIQGRAIIKFIIEKDGSVSDVKLFELIEKKDVIAKKESEEIVSDDDVTADANGQTTGQANKEEIQAAREALIEEALRVVKGMDKWIPGKVGGKTVRVMYVLPISFMLR